MSHPNPFKINDDYGAGGDFDGRYKTFWVEESFDVEGENKLAISHTKNYLGSSIGGKAALYFLIIICSLFGIFFSRIFFLQIIKGDYYLSLAEGNRIRLIPVAAQRGIIYDRFGQDLLKNIPSFSLSIIPQDLPRTTADRERVLSQLADMSGVSQDDIQKMLIKYRSYSYQSLILKDNLDYDTALKLYIENASMPGVEVESGSKRSYYFLSPTSSEQILYPSLSHLIGYEGKLNDDELSANKATGYLPSDLIGKTGLEKSYEADLRGTYGRKKIEVNAIGKEQNVLAVDPPAPGKNLILTLDLEAQKKLESLVKDTADKTGRKEIAAIAMDPKNGEILAMVSWPGFDNNEFVSGISADKFNVYLNDPAHPLFNRVIGGSYPPGSTVKLVVSTAALQENIVTVNTTVNSVGGITVGGKVFKDWKVGGHGITNITKAIAWSVNTFFYYVGGGYDKFVGLGIDRLAKYFQLFGIAQKTGIDLPGESTGFIPSKDWKKTTKGENWYVGDTYNVSIGQGDLLVSPLQVALWTSAVANHGNLVTPHLGQKIVDPVNKTETKLNYQNTKILGVSDSNLAIVRQGMRNCVTLGSCKMLGSLSFNAAGKTGTAQWSKSSPTHAWFTSYAPYEDPKIVVTVLVESGGEGSSVAQPIAQQFLDWWGKKYLK